MGNSHARQAETTYTRGALLRQATHTLKAAGTEVPHRVAAWLMADALGCTRAELHAYPEQAVREEARAAFLDGVARVARGEPLQYVLGHADFFGLRLTVTPDVLIPRPETEQLVEAALHLVRDVQAPRILDAGTGSGCIALVLAHERPDAEVWACDVSQKALAIAQANAEALGLTACFKPVDLLASGAEAELPRLLDLLISNPPYLPEAEAETLPVHVRDYEPPEALFCGDDPLRFYRVLATHAPRLLRPGGWLAVEVHAPHAWAVRTLLADAPALLGARVRHDLAGRPRVVTARRTETD